MDSKWSDEDAGKYLKRYGREWGEDLSLRTYTSRLLGRDPSLVLHGGGNTSVKGAHVDILGRTVPAIFVKASGQNLAAIEPSGHTGLDLDFLKRLRNLAELSDKDMVNAFRTHLFQHDAPTPSIETLVHVFIDRKFIDHTHADAILTLTNQADGEALVRKVLGDDVIVLDYFTPGFRLAKAAADAFEASPDKKGMVWMRHGLITWGETARESYEATIEIVNRTEAWLVKHADPKSRKKAFTLLDTARARWLKAAPILRGLLARSTGHPDHPLERIILVPLIEESVLHFLNENHGRALALTPAATADHLIRTKAYPCWIDDPDWDDAGRLKEQMAAAIDRYENDYDAYLGRHAGTMEEGLGRLASAPRVILVPGMGAACSGEDIVEAGITRDITRQTVNIKNRIAALGAYQGLSEEELFAMEYRGLQHAKLKMGLELPLRRRTALVTGAAGAIGAGICKGLLAQGCHVAVTDLPGDSLDRFVEELRNRFGDRVLGIPVDVTDPESVALGFDRVIMAWGGLDLLVVNAGIALVSSLEKMDLEDFRRLEHVNVEGTLTMLRQAARHFRTQGIGGDVVLISTKNVFAPGAGFGAYSATKAASHQLARIASLEMAELGVRVNMVAPDAVFSEGDRKSGLWAEVGPDRMRARGLDEAGLEAYYQNRNLLKAKVTAAHVANAVLFFATRQTPTTGATIPVDGGLPDSTPR